MKLTPKPQVSPLIKAFFLGLSGEGKSGSTVPLSIEGPIKGCTVPGPGLELLVLDYDGKYAEIAYAVLDNLKQNGKISDEQRTAALARIDVVVCRENTGLIRVATRGARTPEEKIGVKGSSTAWKKGVKQLEKWQKEFTHDTVLIADSLTHAARASVNYSMEMNGRLNQEMQWTDYSDPQQRIASLMTGLADFPTNVIVCAHQDPIEIYKKTGKLDEQGKPEEELVDSLMAPISIGRAGRINLPSEFNHMLVAASEGTGSAINRYLHTRPIRGVVAKSPFFNAKPRYPISTGWVEYFGLRNQT